jgi:hypothetical protein
MKPNFTQTCSETYTNVDYQNLYQLLSDTVSIQFLNPFPRFTQSASANRIRLLWRSCRCDELAVIPSRERVADDEANGCGLPLHNNALVDDNNKNSPSTYE